MNDPYLSHMLKAMLKTCPVNQWNLFCIKRGKLCFPECHKKSHTFVNDNPATNSCSEKYLGKLPEQYSLCLTKIVPCKKCFQANLP